MVIAPVRPIPISHNNPLPSSGIISDRELRELEDKLPRHVLNAVEAISHEMSEIFGTILHTSKEQLKQEYERELERYSKFYLVMSQLLSSGADINTLMSVSTTIGDKFKAALEDRGTEIIGEEATSDMLVCLFTVRRINKKLTEFAQTGTELGDLDEMFGWSIAYSLASSCVFSYLFNDDGNSRNVRILAHWSRYYASGLYNCAKQSGVFKIPIGKGSTPKAMDEDRFLSEAGLEDLATNLSFERNK